MKKVLILTASFGNGHNAAAYNICESFHRQSNGVQVEVMDLFKSSYGKRHDLVKRVFLYIVEHFPVLWGLTYRLLDQTNMLKKGMGGFSKIRESLREILKNMEPDAVVTTYPAYVHVIDKIYPREMKKPFLLFTVVTDSLSVNSVWYSAPSDYLIVANQLTSDVLVQAGVPEEKIMVFGFPVHPRFSQLSPIPPNGAFSEIPEKKILYIINHGKKNSGDILEKILGIPNTHLTITCGSDHKLHNRLAKRLSGFGNRVQILGWTNQMPELLSSHHLVITKAGGAIVQEAMAARCPMVINQVIPGQEAGNARLVELSGVGAIAMKDEELLNLLDSLEKNRRDLWTDWKKNLESLPPPSAAEQIAEFVFKKINFPTTPKASGSGDESPFEGKPFMATQRKRVLMCDFHTHTNYSDGQLTVPELVDFYGKRGFDCLCITDHLADRKRLVGQLSNLSNLTLPWSQVSEYFEIIEMEKKRAWSKYSMLLMTGIEFNKDGFTRRSSAHLLGIDLKQPIDPNLDILDLIHAIHQQNGLAVASHPHIFESTWGRNTLYLWENQDEFIPHLDAWEIANRDDLFNPVGLKKLPFLANSDFHKPKHIYSWKTLLNCEKDKESIKQCIRENIHVSITLYRDSMTLEPKSETPRISMEQIYERSIQPFVSQTLVEC